MLLYYIHILCLSRSKNRDSLKLLDLLSIHLKGSKQRWDET